MTEKKKFDQLQPLKRTPEQIERARRVNLRNLAIQTNGEAGEAKAIYARADGVRSMAAISRDTVGPSGDACQPDADGPGSTPGRPDA